MGKLREYINKSAKQQAYILILLGIIGVIVSIYYVQCESPKSTTPAWIFSEALSTLSIAFVGFGFFGLLLDARNWKDYFSERVKEIVIENSYLDTLEDETLRDLQTNVLKALFKNPEIDKEGSFLNFFHKNLHKYISDPYREDVSTELHVERDGNSLKIKDKVTYICRASKEKIQSNVRWRPDDGEFEKVEKLIIEAIPPDGTTPVVLLNESGGDLSNILETPGGIDVNLEEKLEKYKDKDGLRIIVVAEYTISASRFQYWQMAHPTKNFDITIKYPDDMSIQYKALFMDGVDKIETVEKGYLKLRYNSWLLPKSGIAWLLR